MSKEESLNIRRKKRYSHIYIGLHIKIDNKLTWIKALDWNEKGFNFFLDHKLDEIEIEFKKGPSKFKGEILWNSNSKNDNVIAENILNSMLYEELNEFEDNREAISRIIKLIRSQDRIMEKKKLLSVLHRDISEVSLKLQTEKLKEEHQIYRYGVKVDSRVWTGIVNYALETTSVLQAVGNLSKNLSDMNTAC